MPFCKLGTISTPLKSPPTLVRIHLNPQVLHIQLPYLQSSHVYSSMCLYLSTRVHSFDHTVHSYAIAMRRTDSGDLIPGAHQRGGGNTGLRKLRLVQPPVTDVLVVQRHGEQGAGRPLV